MHDAFAKHPLYDKYRAQRIRVRDTLEGSDQVKSKKEEYLPRLVGQSADEYASYILRATFFNITARVYDSNIGMMTRRSPEVKFPPSMSTYLEDAIGFSSFSEIAVRSLKELLAMGSVGVFIDVRADLPVPIICPAENILNWKVSKEGELLRVTFRETQYSDDGDCLNYTYDLSLDDAHTFQVETYVDEELVGVVSPSVRGRTLDFIPFIAGNIKGLSMEPVKSPILDIVDLNLSHYRSSADYEHGLHFVALPTPIFSGVTFDTAVKLGGASGIVLPDNKAKAYYLEFQGQGLDALAKALITKQSQISLFSARLQDTNTKGSEAESTVKLRYSADSASLYNIAASAELVLSAAYNIIYEWLGAEGPEVAITLNKDFLNSKLSPAELKELASAYVSGAMDEETYLYNLERGEISIPGKTQKLPPLPSASNPQNAPADGEKDDNKGGNKGDNKDGEE